MAGDEPTAAGLLGGLVICFCFMFMLYGVTVTQSYIYFLNCSEDRLWMKVMVGALCFMETCHSAFCIRLLYYFTVIGFGSFEIAGSIDWSVGPVILLENAVVAIVEGFFIRRIWILSNHSYILTFVPLLLLVARIVCHTTAAVFALTSPTWVAFQQNPGPNINVEISNAVSAAVDAMIAGTMIWYLHRGQSGFARTDGVVRWLMSYSVNSGAIMMVVSLAIAITYVCLKESLLFLGLVMIVSKLYANSLLGTLNARQLLRRQATSAPVAVKSNNYELSKFQVASQMRRIEIFRERTEVTDAGPAFEERSKPGSLNC
ncbi:unnamed protein product [Somion occarium]|uniref:DUF6534 domain-containing protein n=1 Tax=Somion occarium TaxID=3059160 RepID=A0ABP1D6V0_9APHY